MQLSEQLQEFKKTGQSCKVRYGSKLTAEGKVQNITTGITGRVWVTTRMGEYCIPLDQVKTVEPSAVDG